MPGHTTPHAPLAIPSGALPPGSQQTVDGIVRQLLADRAVAAVKAAVLIALQDFAGQPGVHKVPGNTAIGAFAAALSATTLVYDAQTRQLSVSA